MRSPAYAVAALTLLLAFNGCTRACKNGTLLLTVTLGNVAAAATSLEVDVSIDGAAPKHSSVARAGGSSTGTVEIDFPAGYPSGHAAAITVTATDAGAPLAIGSVTVSLGAKCTNAAVDISDTASLVDMSCVFQSAEDCFNGIDDDCNGLTDCADPACTAGSECVPAAVTGNGFALGTSVAANAACPAQYDGTTPTDLHQGLSGGANCTGCSCSATVSCSASLYVYTTPAVCTADSTLTGGSLIGTVNNATTIAECNAHTFAVADTYRVGAYQTTSNPCVAAGSATKTMPTWTTDGRFCKADKVGAGCTAGYACVPKIASSPHCQLASGAQACDPGYAPMGSWFTGFSDTRSCGACGCGTQTPGDCVHDVNANLIYFQIFFGGCGSGINNNHPSNSQQCTGINNADGAYGWDSTQFNPVRPSCPASAALTGALTGTGPQVLCCKS